MQPITKECAYCGKEFETPYKDKKYCSGTCQKKASFARNVKPMGEAPVASHQSPVTGNRQQATSHQPATSWETYALQQEQIKVADLKTEVERLKTENKTLDTKVREFEKEEIRKQNELEKMTEQATSKSGLGSVVKGIAEDPESKKLIIETVGAIAAAFRGDPAPALGAAASTGNPTIDAYLDGIAKWLLKQPEALQEQFMGMVSMVSQPEAGKPNAVSERLITIINYLQNGTPLKRAS
jgi:hypothetical protein